MLCLRQAKDMLEDFLMTQCSVPQSSVEILLSGFEHAGLS